MKLVLPLVMVNHRRTRAKSMRTWHKQPHDTTNYAVHYCSLTLFNLAEELRLIVVVVEWRVSAQQDVGDHTR